MTNSVYDTNKMTDEEYAAYNECKIFSSFSNSEIEVMVPSTRRALEWLSRGTEWKTDISSFASYQNKAPLLIMKTKQADGTISSWQLWASKDEIHFIDERGKNYMPFIKEGDPRIPVLEWAVEENGEALKYFDKKLRTEKLCLNAVRSNGRALRHVPLELCNYNMCVSAVMSYGRALDIVPVELRDKQMCELAVENDPWALEFTPKALRSREMCLDAIKKDGRILQHVPPHIIDKDFCMEALRNNPQALAFIPDEHLDREMLILAAKSGCLPSLAAMQAGKGVLSDRKFCQVICRKAVEVNGLSLRSVPEEFRDETTCLSAIKQNGMALAYTPDKILTIELCMEAIRKNGMALEHVPERFRTPELCMAAVQQNGVALQFVPEKLKTGALCREALSNNEEAAKFIPEKFGKVKIIEPIEPKWDMSILDRLRDILAKSAATLEKGTKTVLKTIAEVASFKPH